MRRATTGVSSRFRASRLPTRDRHSVTKLALTLAFRVLDTLDAIAPIPQRVLFLVENLSVPDDVRVWAECRTAKHAGFDVVVVCPQGTERDRDPFELRDGIAIHRFPPSPASGSRASYLKEYLIAMWRIRRLARKLARDHPLAIVHAANPPDVLLPAVRSLKRAGTRFIFDIHDLVPELYLARFGGGSRLAYRLALALERLSLHLADVVVTANDSYRRIALERGRLDSADVFAVRNGPNPDVIRPVESQRQLTRGKKYLLAYVGVMGVQDGVDYAIRALAILKRKREDWHALFVGDGDAAEDVRRLADDLGLSSMVEFPGFRPQADVIRILSTADVCLAPEPKDPLNDISTFIKIGEYMAAARPIVSFDLVESRFSAGEAAVYAEPNDELSFATRIDELLDDPERRVEMGRLGRARIEQQLSWKNSEPALLAAYDRAVGKAPTALRKRRERFRK